MNDRPQQRGRQSLIWYLISFGWDGLGTDIHQGGAPQIPEYSFKTNHQVSFFCQFSATHLANCKEIKHPDPLPNIWVCTCWGPERPSNINLELKWAFKRYLCQFSRCTLSKHPKGVQFFLNQYYWYQDANHINYFRNPLFSRVYSYGQT